MDYSSWETTLFEELHPSARITFGDIKLASHLIVVTWGDHTITVPASEFYENGSVNPLYDIKHWAYESLPVIDLELSKSYVTYNTVNASYEAHTLRSMGTKVLTRNVNPQDYPNYGKIEQVTPFISTEMNGTLICMSSKDKRIPSTLAISDNKVFRTLVEQHMDYSDDLCILIPEQSSHVFAGYRTAVERLQENFQQGTTLNITSGEWFKNITKDEG